MALTVLGFKGRRVSSTQVDLRWDATPGAGTYDLERDGVIIATDLVGTTYNDTGLTPGVEYDYRVRAVYGAPVFSPTDIAGCTLWLDASDAATITASSGAVSQWDDKSPSGYDVGQGTSGAKPTTGTRTLNGLNTIDFDGGDWLERTSSPINNASDGSWTVFAVALTDTVTGIHSLVDGDDESGNRIGQYVRIDGTTSQTIGFSTLTQIPATDSGSAVSISDPCLFTSVNTGTTVEMFVNGTSAGSTALAATQSYKASNPLNIGKYVGGSAAYWDGQIAEIIAYDLDLSVADREQVEDYLRVKWGTPLFTGGSVSVPGDGYVYHTFTTSGTLTPIGDPVEVEYLVVAGGGGGGMGNGAYSNRTGGGGGAGGVISPSVTIASAQTVTVGGGGAAGSNGTATSLGAITASGGGAGGSDSTGSEAGSPGGSGGGNQHGSSVTTNTGVAGQGNRGGDGFNSGVPQGHFGAGGGGGKAAPGGSGESSTSGHAGYGGDGLEWPAGSGDYYAGGGGGGAQRDITNGSGAYMNGLGGNGGGGYGARADEFELTTTSIPGSPNTGGGGGGGAGSKDGNTGLGSAGGSGIVRVRYPVDYAFTGVFDRFDRADGGLGSAWTTLTGSSALSIVSNQVGAATTTWREAYWNAQTFSGDQYAEIDAIGHASWTAANSVGIGISQDAPGNNGYSFYWTGSGGYYITRWTAGSSTIIASVTGQGNTGTRRIRAQRVGSQLTMFVNGTQVLTVSDATHTSGYTTIFVNNALPKLDNFVAGAL